MQIIVPIVILLATSCLADALNTVALESWQTNFKPHIDVDNEWLDKSFIKNAAEQRRYKKTLTHMDEYFSPEDMHAADALARILLNNLSSVASDLVEMKLIVTKLRSLQSNADPFYETYRKEYPIRFHDKSKSIVTKLLDFGKPFIDALALCTTDACVRSIRDAAKEMMSLAKDLDQVVEYKVRYENNFDRLILAKAFLVSEKECENKIALKAFKNTIGIFLALWNGERSPHDSWHAFLDEDISKNVLGLALHQSSRLYFDSVEHWIDEATKTAVYNQIHQEQRQKSYRTTPLVYAKTIRLNCNLNNSPTGQESIRASFIVGGGMHHCVDEMGAHYQIIVSSFGVQLGSIMPLLNITIHSKKRRTAEGTWHGADCHASGIVGVDGAVLTSKNSWLHARGFVFGIAGSLSCAQFKIKSTE